MELGAFSVSLSVSNIEESKIFYQKLGFEMVGGDQSQNWLILRNGNHSIGLFQGMFEGNIMTFNPGWDSKCKPLESYTDVRELKVSILYKMLLMAKVALQVLLLKILMVIRSLLTNMYKQTYYQAL
ncbi:VOC family protein [Psychromonas sp. Urea-02u-13]|uniref:VOC family protein n=1 Tax=Psychromonas sp. Urea-02u-13 TaxID=2058326 RepID=UPI0026AED804